MRKILEAAAVLVLAVLFAITANALYGAHPLDMRIPTHFNAAGQPDAWGSPGSLWLLPIIGVALYLLITLVSLFPAASNFPVRTTPRTRPLFEALTIRMMAWIKLELASLFCFIQWSIVSSVRSGHAALPPAFMPVFLIIVFGTVTLHAVLIFRAAHQAGAR